MHEGQPALASRSRYENSSGHARRDPAALRWCALAPIDMLDTRLTDSFLTEGLRSAVRFQDVKLGLAMAPATRPCSWVLLRYHGAARRHILALYGALSPLAMKQSGGLVVLRAKSGRGHTIRGILEHIWQDLISSALTLRTAQSRAPTLSTNPSRGKVIKRTPPPASVTLVLRSLPRPSK